MRRLGHVNSACSMVCFALVATMLFFQATPAAAAQDADALLKQFNTELRQSQNDMFAGKSERAVEFLGALKELLDRVEALDPNTPKLKAAKGKYTKLVKDLERRTGRGLGGATTTVAAGSGSKRGARGAAVPCPETLPAGC
jgi:Skp family chaperone for outer membrane proteins